MKKKKKLLLLIGVPFILLCILFPLPSTDAAKAKALSSFLYAIANKGSFIEKSDKGFSFKSLSEFPKNRVWPTLLFYSNETGIANIEFEKSGFKPVKDDSYSKLSSVDKEKYLFVHISYFDGASQTQSSDPIVVLAGNGISGGLKIRIYNTIFHTFYWVESVWVS